MINIVKEALNEARKEGLETEFLSLSGRIIKPCDACLSCKKAGKCVIQDDFETVYEKMVEGKYKEVDYNQVFYGITNEERKALSEIDKKTLDKYRKNISARLLEIENILRKKNSNRIHNLAFVQIFKSSNITKEIDF